MARGWESKSVESQQAGEDLSGEKKTSTAAEREHAAKRAELELQIARIQRELETAVTPAHRASKQHALDHLERALAALGKG